MEISPTPTVELSVLIDGAPADVWRALIDPELAPRWMGMRITCSWEIGSAVTITETPLGPDYRELGTLLAFEPGKLVPFDHWSPPRGRPDTDANRAVVTFRVEPDADGTRVTFTHALPKLEAIAEHSDFFWRVALGLLRELVERPHA